MSNEAESEILQASFVIHHHKLQLFLPRLKRQIQSTGEGGAKEVKVKSMPYQFENPMKMTRVWHWKLKQAPKNLYSRAPRKLEPTR